MCNKLGLIGIMFLVLFGGCTKEPIDFGTLDKTPYPTRACNKTLSQGKELRGIPVSKIVVFKKKRRLYAYDATGYKMYEFRISLGKNGDNGHKIKAGDYKTPIGHYKIIRKKCDNRLYRSLMISYPDAEDRRRSRKLGVHPGGYITIHGQPKWNADGRGDNYTLSHDWTEGCIAIPNKSMDKLWQAVRNGVKIDIHP